MSLDQIITVTIDRNTTTPTRAGFGTPLIAGYFPTSIFPERARAFSSLTELGPDGVGFKTTDPVYIAASDIFAQNPSPPTIKVGRRSSAPQQTLTLTPGTIVEGDVFTATVTGYADSAFASRAAATDTATYTAGAGDTATDVCNGLRTSFGTPSGDFSIGGTSTLTITADNTTMDGLVFGVVVSTNISVQDTTIDPGIAADLAAINSYDPDWYGLCIDSNSEAEINAAAAWVQTAKKVFVAQTQDGAVAGVPVGSDTTSVAADLKTNSYDRTMLFFHRNNLEYVSGAMLGRALPEDAGSITWAYKQLASVSSQTTLNTTQLSNLEAKDVNSLTTLAGVAVTRYGTSSQGEYLDVIRGADWLEARIKEDVYAALVNNDKIPYTDSGIQAIRGIILARLEDGVSRGFLAADPEPTCDVPRAADVSAADKGSRTLNNGTFRAVLAGAIHKVAIEGELNLT